MTLNREWVEKAEALSPRLFETEVLPKRLVEVVADEEAFQGWAVHPAGEIESLRDLAMGKGDSVIVDFGDHQVGYVSLNVRSVGSPPDAPLRMKLVFGEMPCEMGESFEDYDGWLSRSWLQDELINVDVLPSEIRLPRRYCFRYMKIVVEATSVKYNVVIEDIRCMAVSSGDPSDVAPLPPAVPEDLRDMDRIALKTLQDCMQNVFEDGPKRDRRLWIGDLRLQALANYETFRSNDLVKRCLYLFAGMRLEGGEVGACVFEKPAPHVDDTLLYDYALFFVATLHDYYAATGDRETLEELWPVAREQLEIGLRRLDDTGIVKDDPSWWCFTDWHPDLNKQGPAQAVLLYALRRGATLANALEQADTAAWLQERLELVIEATISELWDEEQGFFVSGAGRQVSWATQIWMVLAEVFDEEHNRALLLRLFDVSPAIKPSTPYMYHHLIEALITGGLRDKALEQMRSYWGEMVRDGADTFWELYNPEDKKLSPYGSNLINSYCHAWSCTPTYFIRKYFME